MNSFETIKRNYDRHSWSEAMVKWPSENVITPEQYTEITGTPTGHKIRRPERPIEEADIEHPGTITDRRAGW